MIEHFKSSFQENFKKEFNSEDLEIDKYYENILTIYNTNIKNYINFNIFNVSIFEILLDISFQIFKDYDISKDDEYNLKLYNIFSYKLNENNIDTIEFNNYIINQLNNSKLYYIFINYLNDVRNIINNFVIIDINLKRLDFMLSYNRKQHIKNTVH